MSERDRLWDLLGWGAFAFSASAFLLPLINPDLYWHLSAGKYTLAHGGPPHTDFLSWPLAGADWVDFEWLPQVLYYLLHKLGGFRALFAFKVLLLSLLLLVFRAIVLLYGRRAALPFLLPFFAAAPVAIAVVMVSAVLLERIAFRPVRGASGATMLLTSFAVAVLLQLAFQLFISTRPQVVPLPEFLTATLDFGGFAIGVNRVISVVVAIVVLSLLSMGLDRLRSLQKGQKGGTIPPVNDDPTSG